MYARARARLKIGNDILMFHLKILKMLFSKYIFYYKWSATSVV